MVSFLTVRIASDALIGDCYLEKFNHLISFFVTSCSFGFSDAFPRRMRKTLMIYAKARSLETSCSCFYYLVLNCVILVLSDFILNSMTG